MGNEKTNTDRRNFKRFKIRLIVRFFCIFMVIYGSLAVLWLTVGPAYSRFYQKGGSLLFAKIGSNGIVRFEQPNNKTQAVDTEIVLCKKEPTDPVNKTSGIYRVPHSSRYKGYYVTALLIALIAATPLTWKRKCIAMFSGMILIHAFIALKLLIQIFHLFSSDQLPLCLFDLNPFFEQLLSVAVTVFVFYDTPSYTVSAIIWIIVCFRRSEWIKFLNAIKEQTINSK